MSLGRRLSAVILTFALAAGQPGVCAGWMPTPEARMACCSDGGSCPMHESEPHEDGSTRRVTQAEADGCCASSEKDDAAPSSFSVAFSLTLVVASAPVAGVLAAPQQPGDIWRAAVPAAPVRVARHVLFSVFLV